MVVERRIEKEVIMISVLNSDLFMIVKILVFLDLRFGGCVFRFDDDKSGVVGDEEEEFFFFFLMEKKKSFSFSSFYFN
jgi:hypothetical protein